MISALILDKILVNIYNLPCNIFSFYFCNFIKISEYFFSKIFALLTEYAYTPSLNLTFKNSRISFIAKLTYEIDLFKGNKSLDWLIC